MVSSKGQARFPDEYSRLPSAEPLSPLDANATRPRPKESTLPEASRLVLQGSMSPYDLTSRIKSWIDDPQRTKILDCKDVKLQYPRRMRGAQDIVDLGAVVIPSDHTLVLDGLDLQSANFSGFNCLKSDITSDPRSYDLPGQLSARNAKLSAAWFVAGDFVGCDLTEAIIVNPIWELADFTRAKLSTRVSGTIFGRAFVTQSQFAAFKKPLPGQSIVIRTSDQASRMRAHFRIANADRTHGASEVDPHANIRAFKLSL